MLGAQDSAGLRDGRAAIHADKAGWVLAGYQFENYVSQRIRLCFRGSFLLPRSPGKRTKGRWIFAFALLFGIASADYFIKSDLGFSIFYLLPVVLITASHGFSHAVLMSALAGALWALADQHQNPGLDSSVLAWNAGVRLSFFVITAGLLSRLKEEHVNARVDPLTRLPNRRRLNEVLQAELARARRYKHPFSVLCMDLDHFKALNDELGHTVGDSALIVTAQLLHAQLRDPDFVFRIGGDEFLVLFPETNQRQAEVAANRLRREHKAAMERYGWNVSLSCGLAVFPRTPSTQAEVIDAADALMYDAKREGSGRIKTALATHRRT